MVMRSLERRINGMVRVVTMKMVDLSIHMIYPIPCFLCVIGMRIVTLIHVRIVVVVHVVIVAIRHLDDDTSFQI